MECSLCHREAKHLAHLCQIELKPYAFCSHCLPIIMGYVQLACDEHPKILVAQEGREIDLGSVVMPTTSKVEVKKPQ